MGKQKIIIAALGLLFIVCALPSFPAPFARDQAAMAYAAHDLCEGGAPYVSFWDQKGPLLVYLYTPGACLGAPRLITRLLDLLTALLIWAMLAGALKKMGIKRAVEISFFYGPIYYAVGFWHLAQGEVFINAMVVGAFLLLQSPGRKSSLAAGALLGLGACVKPLPLFHLLAAIAVDLSLGPDLRKEKLTRAGASLIGFAIAPLFFALAYLAGGHFDALLNSYILFNFSHDQFAMIPGLVWTFFNLFDLLPVAVVAIPAGIIYLKNRAAPRGFRLLLAFFAASLIGVFMQQRLWLYHWLLIAPEITVIAGAGFIALFSAVFGKRSPLVVRTMASLALLVAALGYGMRWYTSNAIGVLAGARDRSQYLEVFTHAGGDESFDLNRSYRIADYVRANTEPDDKILLFGFDANAYLYAERPHATTFFFDLPLTFRSATSIGDKLQADWRRQFIDQLYADPPVLIGLITGDQNPLEVEDSYTQAKNFTEFDRFISAKYKPVGKVENVLFYRLFKKP